MGKIISSAEEQETLAKVLNSNEAAFMVFYGRQSYWKTTTIRNFFQDKGLMFHLKGIQRAKTKKQLTQFAAEFSTVFLQGKKPPKMENWMNAFNLLRKEIEKVSEKTKVILLFDEVPWLASSRTEFLLEIDYCWNRYFSDMRNVVLVLCGTAVAWMIENILFHRGGLHGRTTHTSPRDKNAFLRLMSGSRKRRLPPLYG